MPAKPLADLCGKSMIQRVYERALQAKLVNKVVVATDHEAIAESVRSVGGEAIMTPSGLRSGSDRIAYAAQKIGGADIIVNVQGDEPLIPPDLIDETVQALINDERALVSTPVRKISDPGALSNTGITKVALDRQGYAMYFSRLPIPFVRDGETGHQYYQHLGLYAFRYEFLLRFASWDETPLERAEKLEQLRILEHGYRIKASLTGFESIPIDTPEDAELVRSLLRKSEYV